MKKLFAALLCVVMMCGCKGKIDLIGDVATDENLTPLNGGELHLFCNIPDTLNPISTGYKSINETMYLVYDGMFVTENDFSATPVLATGYSTDSTNTQYTIRLKKGIKFHDGSTFGAEDVVSTFNNIHRINSVYNGNLGNVVSCVAQDATSVVFTLASPQINFVNFLDFPILPSELSENDYIQENKYFTPVGTGRFKVNSSMADKLVLEANKDYHNGNSHIEKIIVSYIKDLNIAKYSFEATEFDVITTDLYSWGDTSMSGDFSTEEYESNRLTYLGFDCANSILADSAVRKAVGKAIDKAAIVEDVMYKHGASADCPINPNAYFADRDYVHEVYEKGAAGNDLKASGWLDLDGDNILDKYFDDTQFSLNFNLIVNSQNPTSVELASYIAELLLEEGIGINVVALNYDGYIAAIGNGEFDMFIGRTDIANDCDVSFMLSGTSDKNFFRYSSSAMEGALHNIKNASGDEGIKNAYKSFDTVFKDESPFIPLYFETDAVFSSVRVKGNMNVSRTGVFTDISKIFVKYKN